MSMVTSLKTGATGANFYIKLIYNSGSQLSVLLPTREFSYVCRQF